MDVFNNQGQKIGYTDRNGNFVSWNNNGNGNQYNGNRNNGNRNQYNGNQQQKKHSGAKLIEKNGVSYISAFNFSKSRGLVTVFIAPYKNSDTIHTSKNGNEYVNLMAQITYKNSGVEKHFPVLMNVKTNRVSIPELGWVVNPRAANGGYCGTFSRK